MSAPLRRLVSPLVVFAVLVAVWDICVRLTGSELVPSPGDVVTAFTGTEGRPGLLQTRPGELYPVLIHDCVASLFRVTWGFLMASAIGIPLGLWLGWSLRAFEAFNPLIQILRPISPIAWIPIAIIAFRSDDVRSVFLIFISAFFPVCVASMAAVRSISRVHRRSAANFGLRGLALFKKVVLPASIPQILVGLRIAMGVAWLVVVAAEMIAVESGLGYLIYDARNAGRRYDLVVAGMLVIGVIGLLLDLLIRRLEGFKEVAWGFQDQ